MSLASLKRARAALLAVATLAVAGSALFAASATPALALCKYGTPKCINKNPGPKPPSVNTTRIPDSNWIDPDCKYYGNCHSRKR